MSRKIETMVVLPSPLNVPFHSALIKHLAKLSAQEREAFLAAYNTLSPDALLNKVQEFDGAHGSGRNAVQRCASTISRCFDVLEQLMRSTTIALAGNPDVSALVVGGARLLIDIAVKYVTFFPKLAAMIEALARYLEILQSIINRLREDPTLPDQNLVFKCAIELYGDWLEFCCAARRMFVDRKGKPRRWITLRTFLRVQWDPFEATFGAIEKDFQRHLDLLLHSGVVAQHNDLRAVVQHLQDERTKVDQKEATHTRIQFMHWIAKIDYEDDHERISSKRHPGTGDWLLLRREFQTWVNGTSSQLLWCYGKPGSGKTVLASHALEHITKTTALDDEIGIVFCYFNYKQAESQKPRSILSTFIKQLCWKRSVLPERLLNFYQKHLIDARTPSLDAVKDALFSLAEDFQEIYLVVDALDECQAEYREEVLNAIVALSVEHRCARAFITSRHENDIAKMFRTLRAPTVVIQAKNTASDISKYVNDSIDGLVLNDKLQIRQPKTRERIVERLVEGADGMFLWVYLQLQNLVRQRSDRDILAELERLPTDLWSTYGRILHIIDSLPTTLQALAQRALTIVFFASRPLRMRELIDLAAVAAGFDQMQRFDLMDNRYRPEDILEACANLLVEDDGVVRPCHFSVQEFFSTPGNIESEPQLSKYFMTPEQGHAKIAIACLRYLSFDFLRGGACATPFSMRIRLDKYPCSRYAAQNFDYHAAMVDSPPLELMRPLQLFLEQPDRSYESILQIRRLQKGSYDGLQSDEFLGLSWPVNARTMVAATKLYSIPGLFGNEEKAGERPAFQAFLQACYDGIGEVVEYLLSEGWDPTMTLGGWKSPLEYATERHHETVCRLLVDSENLSNHQSYQNALRLAFFYGDVRIVRVLLSGLQNTTISLQGMTDNSADLTSGWDLNDPASLDLARLLLSNVRLDQKNWSSIIKCAIQHEDDILAQRLISASPEDLPTEFVDWILLHPFINNSDACLSPYLLRWSCYLSNEGVAQVVQSLVKGNHRDLLDKLMLLDSRFADAALDALDLKIDEAFQIQLLSLHGAHDSIFLKVLGYLSRNGNLELAERLIRHPQEFNSSFSIQAVHTLLSEHFELPTRRYSLLTNGIHDRLQYLTGVFYSLELENQRLLNHLLTRPPTPPDAFVADRRFQHLLQSVIHRILKAEKLESYQLCLDHWPLSESQFVQIFSRALRTSRKQSVYSLWSTALKIASHNSSFEEINSAICSIVINSHIFLDAKEDLYALLQSLETPSFDITKIESGIKGALQIAAHCNDVNWAKELLKYLTDPAPLLEDCACLHIACTRGSEPFIRLALAEGANLRSACCDAWADLPRGITCPEPLLNLSKSQNTPLVLAAEYGHVKIVKALLQRNDMKEIVKEQSLPWDAKLISYFESLVESRAFTSMPDLLKFKELINEHASLLTFSREDIERRVKECQLAILSRYSSGDCETVPPIPRLSQD